MSSIRLVGESFPFPNLVRGGSTGAASAAAGTRSGTPPSATPARDLDSLEVGRGAIAVVHVQLPALVVLVELDGLR